MSIKSAIAHLHDIFTSLEHPGAIPADIKEYALRGIRSELQTLISRVDLSLGTAQDTLTATGSKGPAPVMADAAPPVGTYTGTGFGATTDDTVQVKQDASLMPDYLPPQSAVPVHGDEVGPSIDLAAGSNADPT